jgi:hypothetical protein
MAVVMFDEALQHSLEKWTSDGANLREELRTDSVLEALGATFGLRSTFYGAGDNPGLSDRAWACIEPGSFTLTTTGALSLSLSRGLAVGRDNSAEWVAVGRSLYRWLYLPADQAFAVSACATPGNTRYDIVLLRPALYQADVQTVAIKTVAGPSGTYVGQSVDTKYRYAMRWGTYAQFVAGTADACVKTGTEGVSPTAPTVDAGSVMAWQFKVSTTTATLWYDWRRQPRLPTRARFCLYVNGATAGAFNAATDVTTLAAEGMAAGSPIVQRSAAGVFDVLFTGGVPTRKPMVTVTPVGPTGAERVVASLDLSTFSPSPFRAPHNGGNPGVTVTLYNAAGAADIDCAFYIEIESNDYDNAVSP